MDKLEELLIPKEEIHVEPETKEEAMDCTEEERDSKRKEMKVIKFGNKKVLQLNDSKIKDSITQILDNYDINYLEKNYLRNHPPYLCSLINSIHTPKQLIVR